MTQKDIKMIEKIMESERMGYASFSYQDGKTAKEALVSTTPENIASLMLHYQVSGMSMKITDIAERLLIETEGAQIKSCVSSELKSAVEDSLNFAESIGEQMCEILEVPKDVAEQYFFEEDQADFMEEMGM